MTMTFLPLASPARKPDFYVAASRAALKSGLSTEELLRKFM